MTPDPARILAAHNAIATAIDHGTSCGWEKGEVVLGIEAAERVARMLEEKVKEQVAGECRGIEGAIDGR